MRKKILLVLLLCIVVLSGRADDELAYTIEVTGSATINIVPDRITIEIGLEEYYRKINSGDSVIVGLPEIEEGARKTLRNAGVADSLIVVTDLGNYRNRDVSSAFLMAKRLSAVITDFNQLSVISEGLDRKGVVSFNIVKAESSDIELYNRQGLKAALDAARRKAEFIAQNEGLSIIKPYEIIETTNDSSSYSAFSNAVYASGSGMENMRRILRRYSVKVRYLFSIKP